MGTWKYSGRKHRFQGYGTRSQHYACAVKSVVEDNQGRDPEKWVLGAFQLNQREATTGVL